MNKEDVYAEIEKKILKKNTGCYREAVHNLLTEYQDLMLQLDMEDLEIDKTEMKKNLGDCIEQILSAIDNVDEGLYYNAYEIMEKLFASAFYIKMEIQKDSIFYRMRNVNDEEFHKIKYKNMFHIPLSKRNIIQTERFSAPGYPCLYLGFSSYGCWEEMDRPKLDSCLVSLLKNVSSFYVLNLTLPKIDDWFKSLTNQNRLIWDMLIITFMVKVSEKTDKYKEEYILPQMLMQWIIKENSEIYKTEGGTEIKDLLLGIHYISAHFNRDFNFPSHVFKNLAVPVVDVKRGEYCAVLSNLFKITNPTCYEYEQIRSSESRMFWGKTYGDSEEEKEEERKDNYEKSAFGFIEERLQDTKLFTLNDM